MQFDKKKGNCAYVRHNCEGTRQIYDIINGADNLAVVMLKTL